MISLNIDINPDDILPNKAKYDQEVTDSLQEIAALVPNHKEGNFIRRLWGYFKQELWKQQGCKCAFCEKSIVADDSHLEHFRPKSEVRDEDNNPITREAYWWLVYDHRNYVVSCSTCNNQKRNQFPIEDEGTRVTARDIDKIIDLNDEGVLENEIPYIINPRYKGPEPHLVYSYTPNPLTPMIHVTSLNDTGKKTIHILDLNRIRKNEKTIKDYLPRKRGSVLNNFKKEIRKYEGYKEKLLTFKLALAASPDANLHADINSLESNISKTRELIKEQFLSYTAEFSGMCLFWLKNDTGFENDFIGVAA